MIKYLITTLASAALLATFSTVASAKDPEGSPKFETRYSTALKKAKEENKPLLVVFSASWCGPCQANKKNVYPSDAVKPFHDKFVWVYLDTDEKRNEKPAKEFKVNGIPHIQFVDSNGKPLGQTIGGTTPDAFAKELAAILEKAGGAGTGASKEKAKE